MIRIFAIAAIVGLCASWLVSCASAPTREEFAQTCDAYGFQRGTTDHAYCMQAAVGQYNAAIDARSARMQAAGQALMLQGQAMNQRASRPQPVYPYQPVVNCYRTAWGTQCR